MIPSSALETRFESARVITSYSIHYTKLYDELLQVLINIVKNAKEAILASDVRPGRIVIRADMKASWLSIVLCNNGGGIAKDVMMRMFEPYFTTKEERIGTGLGLYMCKMIVEKHLKGEIYAIV